MADWIATEMAGLDLGDQRLNDRQSLVLERFSANPQGSIPESLQGWAETHAGCHSTRVTIYFSSG